MSREHAVLSRLSGALVELYQNLSECVAAYNQGFEANVTIEQTAQGITVCAPADKVEIVTDTALPGFQVKLGDHQFGIVVGVLPNKKLFYLDAIVDKYLTMEEVTKRILDRSFFPKLPE